MNKTVLVLIDGLRSDAIEAAHTPTLDFLINKGASSMTVQGVAPSITLPSHFSIFTSLAPYSHGVLTNTAMPDMSVVSQSIYHHVKSHSGRVSSLYSWENLRNLALPGTMDYSFFCRLTGEKDLITLATTAAGHLVTQHPEFCFVYFEWVDIIGHRFGWMSTEYIKAVELADHTLGIIIEAIYPIIGQEKLNLLVLSDHGGKGRHHTDPSPETKNVPMVAWGYSVRENFKIKEEVTLLDIAPTICQFLGIPPHFAWEGNQLQKIIKPVALESSLVRVA